MDKTINQENLLLKKYGRVKHNLTNHRLYNIWNSMKGRCLNQKDKDYKNYGGRGIKICDRWLDIKSFIEDMYPTFQEGLTLDRIDVNGDYEKSNCRWATKEVQSQNTRKINIRNKTGYRGVSYIKSRAKYQASICIKNKKLSLGRFATDIEAAKAYDEYVIKYNLEHTRNFA